MTTTTSLTWIENQHNVMLERTLLLAGINSGSENLDGLAQMASRLEQLFKPLGDEQYTVTLPGFTRVRDTGEVTEQHSGKALCIAKRPQAPLQVLLCGHMDTVFARDSHFQQHQFLDDNTVSGPGVADMKGGLMVMLTALQAFEQSPLREQLGWQVVINPDEEIGSLASASLLKQKAQVTHVGMLYEPALADGTLAGERKGSGNFTLCVQGRAAHAGREFDKGRNAIAALAHAMTALHELNGQRKGLTLNLGRIAGGGALNSVADRALCHFNIRTRVAEDEQWVLTHIDRIIGQVDCMDGIHAERHGQFNRPPKILSPANQQLFSWLQESAQELNINAHKKATGGCCDGNNLASAGLPNIDTLGVRGGNIHTDQEFLLVDSLVERAKLSYLLLEKLAQNAQQVIAMRSM